MTLTARISSKHRPVAFLLITAAMLVIAAVHLYLVGQFTEVTLGLPQWVWLQLLVVAGLLVLAWVATALLTPAGRR